MQPAKLISLMPITLEGKNFMPCYIPSALISVRTSFSCYVHLNFCFFLCKNLNNLLMKVGITVAENHCPSPSFDRKKTAVSVVSSAVRNSCGTSTRLLRENIWQKTTESASLVSKFPFYKLHSLTSLIKEGGEVQVFFLDSQQEQR